MLIAFLLPLSKRIVPGFIALYALYAIQCSIRKKKIFVEKKNLKFLFPVILYVMMLVGINFSTDIQSAYKELEFKLSMMAFPLLVLFTPNFTKKEERGILDAFVVGTILFAFFAIFYGIYRAWALDSREYLTYNKLGIYFHPTYMAMYQSITLMVLLYRGIKQEFYFNRKWVHWVLVGVVILFISMLASKAGLISAILVCAWLIFVTIVNGGIRKRPILICTAAIVGLAMFSFGLPLTAQRIERAAGDVTAMQNNDTPAEAHSSTELRKVTWSAAIQVMKDNTWGAGVGNTTHALNKTYEIKGQYYAAEKNLNAHNQFLQVGAEHGLFGLVVFCLFLILLVVEAFKSNSLIFKGFLGILIFNFLFESCLEVQAGVVFFYFFLLVFEKINFKTGEKIWI